MNEPSKIDYLLEEIVTLPSLPSTVTRLTRLINEPDCPLSEVSKAISVDPALSLKTLRLVNSAFYGVKNKVTSIEQAVTLLGLKVIKNLVFTASVFETLNSGTGLFLMHSVACGAAMRLLVEAVPMGVPVEPDDAFAFGLLHDVGKIIFEEFLPKEMDQARRLAQEQGLPSFEAEGAVIGADHAEMGARLAQSWKLSDEVVDAIAGHHQLERCGAPELRKAAALLSIADFQCIACGLAPPPRRGARVDEEMWAAAGITSVQIAPIVDRFMDQLPDVFELAKLAS
ncbi:MAG: HDOD domain-containing protein [Candidatus Hydrogenedentes bacterium]|nr:HDOD domain-containing protein [Candidatus Hydrogenedentota bacterium]